MPTKENPETYCPASKEEWRQWLKKHHNSKPSIWLILHKKESGKPVISWSDAVDEALCFGWVDSTRRPIDEEKFMQFFGKRKAGSTWSKINKDKVERLQAAGLMTSAGLECIEIAKQNGSWDILNVVDALEIPDDLATAFKSRPGSLEYFGILSKSMKKMLLSWLVLAKREETRAKRVTEIAMCAGDKMVPAQFRVAR